MSGFGLVGAGRRNLRAALLAAMGAGVFPWGGPAGAEEAATTPPATGNTAEATASSGTISLDEALALALQQNLSYSAVRARAQQSRGAFVSSYANVLPSVTASAGKSQSTLGSGSEGVIGGFPQVSYTQYSMGGSVRQNLIDLPAWYSFRGSRKGWDAAKSEVNAMGQDIALDVTTRYFDVVTSEKTSELRRETLQLSEDQLRRTQALFDLGAVTKADVLESRVATSRAKRDVIDAENQQVIARGRLNLAIGRPAEVPIAIEHAAFDVPASLPEASVAIADARRQRPDLHQLELELEAAKLDKRAAGWRNMPSLSGSLSYFKGTSEFEDTFDFESVHDFKDDGSRWGYEIGLSIPIFDGLLTKGQKIRAAGAFRAAAEDLAQKELDVGLEVRESLLNIERAKASLEASREETAFAEENLRLREAMYDQGAATILELIQARVDLTTARAAAITNETGLQLAWYQYQRATGVPLFKER